MQFLVICRRVADGDMDAFARLIADEGAVLRKLQATASSPRRGAPAARAPCSCSSCPTRRRRADHQRAPARRGRPHHHRGDPAAPAELLTPHTERMTTQTPGALGTCPFTIDRPVMRQRWERLTFLHWPFEPADVQRLLPDGLEIETHDGAAWVGLVPFYMRVATPGGRRVPWLSNFCETNVRTYVRDRAGRSGIWFFSLEAARLGAVLTARATPYRLPYFWASMRLGERGAEVAYLSERRWPGPRPATSRVRIAVGAADRRRRRHRAGALPDRPLDAVQRHRRPPGLRARLPPALAAAPRPRAGARRPPAHRGGPARPGRRTAGALLPGRRRRDRPSRALGARRRGPAARAAAARCR